MNPWLLAQVRIHSPSADEECRVKKWNKSWDKKNEWSKNFEEFSFHLRKNGRKKIRWFLNAFEPKKKKKFIQAKMIDKKKGGGGGGEAQKKVLLLNWRRKKRGRSSAKILRIGLKIPKFTSLSLPLLDIFRRISGVHHPWTWRQRTATFL